MFDEMKKHLACFQTEIIILISSESETHIPKAQAHSKWI